MSKKFYQKRVFLNPEIETTAYIVAVVPATKEGGEGFYPTLEIKDCSRAVNLDFSCSSYSYDRSYKQAKKKLLLLKDIIDTFVDASLEQIDVAESNALKNKEKDKQKPQKARSSLLELLHETTEK